MSVVRLIQARRVILWSVGGWGCMFASSRVIVADLLRLDRLYTSSHGMGMVNKGMYCWQP